MSTSTNQYSLPGVLNFIQQEFRRFELDRVKWQAEKAELQTKISLLEGERKGQENLKKDLVRRIKMLEFALRQERMRASNGEAPRIVTSDSGSGKDMLSLSTGSLSKDKLNAGPNGNYSSTLPAKFNLKNRKGSPSRAILRQYLEEVGYNPSEILNKASTAGASSKKSSTESSAKPLSADTFVPPSQSSGKDKASNDNKNQNEGSASTSTESSDAKSTNAKSSKGGGKGGKKGDQKNWAYAKSNKRGGKKDLKAQMREWQQQQANGGGMEGGEESTDAGTNGKDKDAMGADGWDFNDPNESLRQPTVPDKSSGGTKESSGTSQESSSDNKSSTNAGGSMDNELMNMTMEDPQAAIKKESTIVTGSEKTWKAKTTLRSHFDGVRAVSFHETEPWLLSASEDYTLKIWNLQYVGAGGGKKTTNAPDVEPIVTMRGHTAPIYSAILSTDKDLVFSAGADKTIRLWSPTPGTAELYDAYGSACSQKLGMYTGHTDAIWDLDVHPFSNFLLSASADGTVCLWDIEQAEPLVRTLTLASETNSSENQIPTSVEYIRTDNGKAIVSYQGASLAVFDAETGSVIQTMSDSSYSSSGLDLGHQINKVITHPTSPIAITAHEDKAIKFWDLKSGECIHSMVAHLDSVSSLSIDNSGLYLLSGSHDTSIRFWDIGKKQCVQECTAHRKKYSEAVHCVAFHPTMPYVATGGADSNIKIFH